MDFLSYAEGAASLVNTDLPDGDALRVLVEESGRGEWLSHQCTDRDATVLRQFQRQLRAIFSSAAAEDTVEVIDGLNELMEAHPISPRISAHDPDDLHLHVANRSDTVATLLIGESLLGLATLICDLGPERLGVCAAAKCDNVYVDTSPNRSRRYCSDRCSSRANVAAYRARQKAASA